MVVDSPPVGRFGRKVARTGAAGVLAVQLLAVRPALSRRTAAVLRGEDAPGSRTHLVYVALELLKVGLLVALGVIALS